MDYTSTWKLINSSFSCSHHPLEHGDSGLGCSERFPKIQLSLGVLQAPQLPYGTPQIIGPSPLILFLPTCFLCPHILPLFGHQKHFFCIVAIRKSIEKQLYQNYMQQYLLGWSLTKAFIQNGIWHSKNGEEHHPLLMILSANLGNDILSRVWTYGE